MQFKQELQLGIGITLVVFVITLFYLSSFKSVSAVNQNNSQSVYTLNEISKHNTANDCWIIVNSKVYNVTDYINLHPGGPGAITRYCGNDATDAFNTKGGRGSHSSFAVSQLESLLLGLFGNQVQK